MRRIRSPCCARAASGHGRRAAEERDELAPLSFDHLVGARKQRWGHLNTERLGGLEIDDQLEFGRPLDRKSAGLAPLRIRST